MNVSIDAIENYLLTDGVNLAIKLAASLALWIIGRRIISLLMGVVSRAIVRGGRIDATTSRYVTSILSVLLTIGLVLGIFGYLGVQTTSFAALLAGIGLAIGTAWGGLLAHFAAGLFMQILRPFKVGDYVSAGGIEGTVKEMGLFGTTIITPDNVATIVGNNKVFSDTIKNFSAQEYRRVDCVAKVANTVDPKDAMVRLRAVVAQIPNVRSDPPPVIDLLEFTAEGPRLCVRPYCDNEHYWQVYFDTNRAIVEVFGAAAYPVPTTPMLHLVEMNPLTKASSGESQALARAG
ncbi:MAG TPA: mechanosensitive ion channel family protein [Steroidobacteraceae bacterium]|nr:mechanosensitive ion channel family protein [Steroidobacteraceae bacterium]